MCSSQYRRGREHLGILLQTLIIRWWARWVWGLIRAGNIIYVPPSQIISVPTRWISDVRPSPRLRTENSTYISPWAEHADRKQLRNKESFRERRASYQLGSKLPVETDSTPRLRDTISKTVFAVILLIWLSYTTNTCTAVPQSWNCKFLNQELTLNMKSEINFKSWCNHVSI